jgi:hypothetical protein
MSLHKARGDATSTLLAIVASLCLVVAAELCLEG